MREFDRRVTHILTMTPVAGPGAREAALALAANTLPVDSVGLGRWAAPVVVAVLLALAAALCVALGPTAAKPIFAETGPVEIATPLLYVLTAALYLTWRRPIGATSLVPVMLLVLMALRELDADKWVTNQSLLSTGYYFDNPGISYVQRIVVGAAVAAVGLVTLHFFWRSRRGMVRALRDWPPYAVSIVLAFVLMAVSQMLDGLGRTYIWLAGEHLTQPVYVFAGAMEETSELGMSLAFLVALLQLRFDPGRNALAA